MMKRFFLLVMAVGLTTPTGAYAQEVYKNSDNRAILDLRVATGMPAGAVTDVSKTEIYKNFTPQTDVLGTDNGHNESINATVFQKLEVAPKDMNATGETGGTGTLTMNWITAFEGCKNSTYDGGDWRLPTERELMLIYIFKPALEAIFTEISGTAFASAWYWSSTERNERVVWRVRFEDGYTETYAKTAPSTQARCVREVTN